MIHQKKVYKSYKNNNTCKNKKKVYKSYKNNNTCKNKNEKI